VEVVEETVAQSDSTAVVDTAAVVETPVTEYAE
jgi:hypothetical protein